MKGIFLYNKKLNYNKLTGIDKKVLWQVEGISNQGFDCRLMELYDNHKGKADKILGFLMARLPSGNAEPKVKWNECFSGIDFLYFRRPDALSAAWIKLLKRVKKENRDVKIIMEIPNYPYDDELGFKLINRPLLTKDRIFRKELSLFVDRIALQNDIDEVFGIKTIVFTNGIKIDDINVRIPTKRDNNSINICAVASLEPWQGYERIITGLKKYRENGGSRKININIIGSGSDSSLYEELIHKYKLQDSINLLGRKNGDELEQYYNEADLALDAFGRYKTGNKISTSLKSREYLAKGIPIITGCKTDVLNDDFPYFLQVGNDSSDVEFERIVEFYDSIYSGGKEPEMIVEEIRQYAKRTCDISAMVDPITNYLKQLNVD